LHLLDKATYRYLGAHCRPLRRDEDTVRFEQLKIVLKNIGLSKRHVAQTCQLFVAILHLGNIDFVHNCHRNKDTAVVRNTELLNLVAEFLGVTLSTLEIVFLYKTKLVKKELCTVFLNEDGTAENRDSLAKMLYSLLFAWINKNINQKLCREDYMSFIGLFDLLGSQNIPQSAVCSNLLDQFCVNFANECLHNWVQKCIFEYRMDGYATEGVRQYLPTVSFFDLSECICMLTSKPGGVIHIMDNQARHVPKMTEHMMAMTNIPNIGRISTTKQEEGPCTEKAAASDGMYKNLACQSH